MKKKICFYSSSLPTAFIENLFSQYLVNKLTLKDFNNKNLFNRNIILFDFEKIESNLNKNFFLHNSVVVFLNNKENQITLQYGPKTTFITTPIKLKKFLGTIDNVFLNSHSKFGDVEIYLDSIKNLNTGKKEKITALEKKILIELFEHKKIKRDYFLENILQIKKEIQTKTIESHLTRIRKKIFLIKSQIQISSKEDNFFIEI